ncbi:uncharacterized protein SETTUDRAFT_169379 [Exserohilum turcica Et28A]|uniref:Uncharacterized protein n=1 Tax=Exserohilum turcicum (strain 28A) TaxID=671987 RepID=R0IMI6_EXST2|nr:uncharacterized protein SETTUDRAFT_169379 [Exserohilum turcica Et28A]EOA86006.1 hypothetical protein SETTUDRAFT_169379 [Exserohilum turcica Et28A]
MVHRALCLCSTGCRGTSLKSCSPGLLVRAFLHQQDSTFRICSRSVLKVVSSNEKKKKGVLEKAICNEESSA